MHLFSSILGIIISLLFVPAYAKTIEFTDHSEFVLHAGNLDITNFDNLPTKTKLSDVVFDDFVIHSRGATIVNPQDFSPGLIVSGTNINSLKNGISVSLSYNSLGSIEFDNLDDNFEFILNTEANAAGLWVGNLGKNDSDPNTVTIVSFFDAQGNVLASKELTQVTEGIIGKGANNRIFYGIVTNQNIKSFAVENAGFDGDGIILDDIQFSPSVSKTLKGFSTKLDGIWEGTGRQSSSGLSQQWSIQFTAKNGSYLIKYPSLACSGKWEFLSETSGSVTFVEDIEVGLNSCLDKGTVELLWIENNKLRYTYYLSNGNIDAFGELQCSDCSVALNSATFENDILHIPNVDVFNSSGGKTSYETYLSILPLSNPLNFQLLDIRKK